MGELLATHVLRGGGSRKQNMPPAGQLEALAALLTDLQCRIERFQRVERPLSEKAQAAALNLRQAIGHLEARRDLELANLRPGQDAGKACEAYDTALAAIAEAQGACQPVMQVRPPLDWVRFAAALVAAFCVAMGPSNPGAEYEIAGPVSRFVAAAVELLLGERLEADSVRKRLTALYDEGGWQHPLDPADTRRRFIGGIVRISL